MTTTTSVSFDLGPGERLLWSGVPGQGLVFRAADLMLVPFSLIWGGFAIFWEITALRNAPFFFSLWGIPFVLVGLYLIVGRFFQDALRRRRTFYGLTSERVIIASGIRWQSVKSLSLRTLSDLSLDERANGTGTIGFGPQIAAATWQRRNPWSGAPGVPAFEMISDAKRIFGLIRDAQRDDASIPA